MIPALCTILDIPLHGVLLVVDNAKSPACPVSLKNTAHAFHGDACRWSSMPPLISSVTDDVKNRPMNNTVSLTSIFKDIVHEKKICTPIRIPIRQESRDSIFHGRKDNNVTNADNRRMPIPAQPATANEFFIVRGCTSKINENKHSTRPLRIPVRQQSRRRIFQDDEPPVFISDHLSQAFTTAELLSKVLKDLDC